MDFSTPFRWVTGAGLLAGIPADVQASAAARTMTRLGGQYLIMMIIEYDSLYAESIFGATGTRQTSYTTVIAKNLAGHDFRCGESFDVAIARDLSETKPMGACVRLSSHWTGSHPSPEAPLGGYSIVIRSSALNRCDARHCFGQRAPFCSTNNQVAE
jgi:hypothetical protein